MHIVCENIKARNEANVQRVQGTNHPDIYGQVALLGVSKSALTETGFGRLQGTSSGDPALRPRQQGAPRKARSSGINFLRHCCKSCNAKCMPRREEFKVHSGKMSSVSRGV